MKRFVLIMLVFIILFLCSCQTQEIRIYKDNKNEGYKLDLHAFKNIGYSNLNKASDLISTARRVAAEDMFEIDKFEIKAGSQTPPQIAVVSGEVYAATTIEDKGRDYLYKLENGKQHLLYDAGSIYSLFEHNGCLLFCATESSESNVYKLMKYNPKAKTLICLDAAHSDKLPIYSSCGDYISVTDSPELNLFGNAYMRDEKCNVRFCNFSTGEDRDSNKTIIHVKESVVPIKDVKNNLYITFDRITSQLLFYDADKQMVVSQSMLDVIGRYSLISKFFGSRLIMKDSGGLILYDFNDDSYKLIYKPNIDRIRNGESYCEVCEIIDSVIIFTDLDNLTAYDMKNNTFTTLGAVEDMSYSGTDNETTFAFCSADVDSINNELYYNVYRYKLT